ncbi:MAG: ThuA domain-containing protein [Ferruginibacter sp.]
MLIVDGFSNHDWAQTTKLIRLILEESKLFKVSVSTTPSTVEDSAGWAAWNPNFKDFDVVIQNTNNLPNSNLRWPRKIEMQLEDYVRSGGGLYILHSANNSFTHWKEYDKMIGLGWRPKESGYALEIGENNTIIRISPGEGKATSHGARFNAVINIINRHPINSGMPQQWKAASTEVYNYSRGAAENITILSVAFDSSATKKTWPAEWLVKYGKGNVYNSVMGHLWKNDIYPLSYRCIGFQTTVIRVTEWLGRGKVTYPIPANFPTKDNISVRDETDLPKSNIAH